MPLAPQTMSTFTVSKGASLGLVGSKFPIFVAGVSAATCQYLMATSTVNSVNVVLGIGSGTHTGKIMGLIPSAMSGLMSAKAASAGIVGRDSKKLFDAVSFGVVQSLNLVIVQGSVIGGGPGAGVGKIIGLVPSALQTSIMSQLAARGLVGSKTLSIVSAIAFGICTHIMSAGTVSTICIGSFTPPPIGPIPVPAAPGIGRFA